MFLPLILKFKLYFKMNVMILLVLIYFLWPNPEKSRTSFFFSVRLHCVASLCFFFVGKQSRLRKDACLFAKRCICQYPRGSFFFTFLTSFYFFFFNYRLLISAYRLKEVLDRIVLSSVEDAPIEKLFQCSSARLSEVIMLFNENLGRL